MVTGRPPWVGRFFLGEQTSDRRFQTQATLTRTPPEVPDSRYIVKIGLD